MKKSILLSVSALAIGLLVLVGCESADSFSIAIRASTTSIKAGQTVSLEGEGWDTFNWTVSQDALGYVSPKAGRSTIYYSYEGKGGEQTITAVTAGAQSSKSGTSTNQTTTVTSGYSASIRIEQSGEETVQAVKSTSSSSQSGSIEIPLP